MRNIICHLFVEASSILVGWVCVYPPLPILLLPKSTGGEGDSLRMLCVSRLPLLPCFLWEERDGERRVMVLAAESALDIKYVSSYLQKSFAWRNHLIFNEEE